MIIIEWIKQIRNDLLPIKNWYRAIIRSNPNLDRFIDLNRLGNKNEEICVFLLETSVNGNIGDQAISIAQIAYLEKKFGIDNVFEVPSCNLYRNYRLLKKIIKPSDIICIQGGGNLGNLYMDAEHSRRFIIKHFQNNTIISFPQSTFFTQNFRGNVELKRSRRIYKKHKHLILGARDRKSAEYLHYYFNNVVYLAPDIVLSNDRIVHEEIKREYITTMLREDSEKNLSDSFYKKLDDILNIYQFPVKKSDTWKEMGLNVYSKKRYSAYKNTLEIFSSSKLVITDRLHGMILSYITGTPCIALNNSYKKVENTFKDWLSKSNYIILVDEGINQELLARNIEELLNIEPNFESLQDKFNSLDKVIKGITNE